MLLRKSDEFDARKSNAFEWCLNHPNLIIIDSNVGNNFRDFAIFIEIDLAPYILVGASRV